MRVLILLAVLVASLAAQVPMSGVGGSSSSAKINTAAPPAVAYQFVPTYSGTNMILACWAKSVQPISSVQSVTAATNSNPVVLTIIGHGWHARSKPSITLAGGTGNWVALNGSRPATVVDANTVTVAVDSTSFGALAGTVTASSFAPRLSDTVWTVQALTYDGSSVTWTGFAGGSADEKNACAMPTQVQ